MNVIRFMAVITKLAQLLLVGIAPVAVQAHQLGMASRQLEFSVLVMTEFHLGPFDKAMAFFAFFAHAPFVIIVTPVTVDTFPLQFFLEIVVFMAGIAFRLIVSTPKRKLGLVMIELGLRPTVGVMTFVTFFTKASCMNIVQRMTANAFRRRFFVSLIGVATVAGHLLMFSRQAEFCFVVVEPSLAPGLFGMTFGTGFSQPPEVGIILFMAINTAGGRRTVFFAGDMAMTALDGTMLAFEDEIRGFMTEGFQVQLNNVRPPSLVIRVAVLALTPFHF